MKNQRSRGFTIVELLIVVVVIAILAAITIVSYRGISARASTSASMKTLNDYNKLIQLYYADNGTYPIAPVWSGMNKTTDFIPGIVPKYTNTLKQTSMPNLANCAGSTYAAAYMYRSNNDGTEYKLIAHCDGLCDLVKQQQPSLIDPPRDCWAYGYWTSGALYL